MIAPGGDREPRRRGGGGGSGDGGGGRGRARVGDLVGGKYRIVRVLAEGGMGVVCEAQHAIVKRRFAVKFLRPELAARRDGLARFHHEAQAAGALESEHIAAALDFGVHTDGAPYLVLEFLEGESLGALLAREGGRLPIERATDIARQVCSGIAAAHAAGIVHRDLKPENLFVCRREDGTDLVKVLDFGIAKLEQVDSGEAPTRTGAIVGTPAYMAPEQARGEKHVDGRIDVYAIGAVLFEMLSGQMAHPGGSPNALLHHVACHPARPLGSADPGLPPGLVGTVDRALAFDPPLRYPSAEALGRDLAPYARREVWPAPRLRRDVQEAPCEEGAPPEVVPAAPTAIAAGDPSAQGSSRARRSNPILAHGAAVAATLVGALAIGLGYRELARRAGSTSPVTLASTTSPAPPTPPAASSALSTVSREAAGPPRRRPRLRPLPRDSRFFVPSPMPGAVQQIAALVKQRAFTAAASLTAMEATPQAVWLIGGTPDEARSAVQNVIVRSAPDGRIPILVANNIPFRDCAQYSAGGAPNSAAYGAWIEGFASGIGNGRAVVVLEPGSLGTIPNNRSLDGRSDGCHPTVADPRGETIAAPEATPAARYAALNHAVDVLARVAPNALVYLDGTHPAWLGVGEMAYRLVQAGVAHVQGFVVNVANTQPGAQSVRYGTWISKCILYAGRLDQPGKGRGEPPGARYADCASQYPSGGSTDGAAWTASEKWYLDHVPEAQRDGADGDLDLVHFIIDTSRAGRGPLVAARFAAAPYGQPPEVIQGLARGGWCNPPDAGLGPRPTADTGIPLVDAFIWAKTPGGSDGSCDIAGGARAWDYARYNPWGIGGDARSHFDPLWGTVDPAAGEWFPEAALRLALNARPALDVSGPTGALDPSHAGRPGRFR